MIMVGCWTCCVVLYENTLKKGTFYYRIISGEGINFYYSVKLTQKKIAAGENYSHYSFILNRKQKGGNCNHLLADGILSSMRRSSVATVRDRTL